MSRSIRLCLGGVLLAASLLSAPLSAPVEAAPLPDAAGIVAGGEHTCAVTADRQVTCWGANRSGQLGDGTTEDSRAPLPVKDARGLPLIDVQSAAAGMSHSCGLFTDGRVSCWGDNSSGQLGNGSTVDSLQPVAVGGPGTARQLAAGSFHTCALGTEGGVSCWGGNYFGQLGDGSGATSPVPVPVVDTDGVALTGVRQVSVGAFHSCAALADGGAVCWGGNFFGQLGDGSTAHRAAAAPVLTADGVPLTNVREVAVGVSHSCALLTNGRVSCWGNNRAGQLGAGEVDGGPHPVVVEVEGGGQLSSVRHVVAGGHHTCVVLLAGGVRCWGANADGQLGTGAAADADRAVAVRGVDGGDELAGAKGVAAGVRHTCVLLSNDRVNCWGGNGTGQLANRAVDGSTLPLVIPYELTGVKQAVAGEAHTCVLMESKELQCWGANGAGQLGDQTTADRASPAPVLAAGDGGELTGIKQVAAGGNHTCALTVSGRVWCWGANFFGQLGDGSTANASAPVAVVVAGGAELTGIRALSAGAFHTCALTTSGRVLCWGANFSGQLGDRTTVNSPLPVSVRGPGEGGELAQVAELAAGGFHTCVRTTDGGVTCWGANYFGQLGQPGVDGLAAVVAGAGGVAGPLAEVDALTVGQSHSCALLDGGQLTCWGGNFSGQLGDRSQQDRAWPVAVRAGSGSGPLTKASQVAAGGDHACVLSGEGDVSCWGDNQAGQLGDGTLEARTSPTQVAGFDGRGTLVEVREVVVGARHTCVIHLDGRLSCWGDNASGQLGDGTTVARPTPVRVATNR